MIRKRIVHLDFKNNSLRRVFFIKGLDGSGFCDREEMGVVYARDITCLKDSKGKV